MSTGPYDTLGGAALPLWAQLVCATVKAPRLDTQHAVLCPCCGGFAAFVDDDQSALIEGEDGNKYHCTLCGSFRRGFAGRARALERRHAVTHFALPTHRHYHHGSEGATLRLLAVSHERLVYILRNNTTVQQALECTWELHASQTTRIEACSAIINEEIARCFR